MMILIRKRNFFFSVRSLLGHTVATNLLTKNLLS